MLHEAEKCKNKNIYHSWATHVAHRECAEYGVGEVLRHTLNEQGKVQFFDVKFGNKVISNIPTHLLEKKKKKVHKH
jgi:imidazole glycerol phosphate synthase subunit HisF